MTQSENESILTDTRYDDDRNVSGNKPTLFIFYNQYVWQLEDQIISVQPTPPRRPSRRSRSHTSSLSRISLPPSPRDTDSVFTDEGYLVENQQIPSYLIENQNYKQLYQGNAVYFSFYVTFFLVDLYCIFAVISKMSLLLWYFFYMSGLFRSTTPAMRRRALRPRFKGLYGLLDRGQIKV